MQHKIHNHDSLSQNNSSYKKYDGEDYLEFIILRWVPYWPLLVVFILMSISICWGYLKYTPKVYQCKAQILIKEDKNKESKDNILDALDLFGTQVKVENEIAILKSAHLMREVVTELGIYSQLQLEGRVEKIIDYGEETPLKIIAYKPDSLKAFNNIITINPANVIWGGFAYPYDTWCNTPAGVLKFIRKNYQINNNPFIHYKLQITPVKSVADHLCSALDIIPVSKQSTVLQLTITDVQTQRAQDILNTLIKSYAADDIFDKNRLAQKTIDFLNERIRLVSSELENVEGELQSFKEANKAIDLKGQSELYLKQLEENDSKAVEIEIELTTLKQVEEYVNRKKNEEGVVPALFTLKDDLIKDLLTRLMEAESQYNRLVKSAGQNAPNTHILQTQIIKFRQALNENLTEQRTTLLAANKNITDNNKQIQSAISGLPSKEKSLLDISRRQTVKDNLYSYLLQKREETQLSYASALADSRVIDAAESSDTPIRPQSKMIYAIGVSLAFVFFILIVGGFQYLGAKLMFKKELEMIVGIPIIASIGKKSSSSPFIFKEGDKRSWISEQFRNFRTNITFLGFNGVDRKVLLVTSSLPGEGKTFISLNLANAAALSGLKVILLNADLRKPKLHEIFSMQKEPGLVNYLAGTNSINEIIYTVPGSENFFLIPSGTIPPNPSELLGNKRMNELISYLKKHYDLIILDSTPNEFVTDAKVIANLADASIIITRYGVTPLKVLKKIKEMIESGLFPNPSIVFNAVRGQGLSYGYKYYKYGYAYGYNESSNDQSIFSKVIKKIKSLWQKKK